MLFRSRPVLSWPASCEEAFEASASSDDAGLVFTRLSERDTLVDVLCASGGYQPSHAIVLLDDGGGTEAARVLRVSVMTSSDGASWTRTEETEIWGEVRVQAATGDIVVLSVARQTRDCGVWSRYRVGRAGAELTEVWAGLPCRNPPGAVAELADGPPKSWRPVAMK